MTNPPLPSLSSSKMPEFVRLLTQYQSDIYVYIRSLLTDPHAAADVLQEANVVLWEKRDQFEIGTNFRAWAFQIARYKVLQQVALRGQLTPQFSDALINELAAPAHSDDLDFMTDNLRHCLAKLPQSDQDLIRRRYSPLASGQSVADELDRPVRWVYKAVSRIRKMLFDCIKRQPGYRKEGV